MGKKNRKKKGKIVSANGKPFISICTPTYNRRKFIPFLIKCFKAQTYPPQLMEWIVVDDGTDPVGDLFQDVSGVKYYYQLVHINISSNLSTISLFEHFLARSQKLLIDGNSAVNYQLLH